MRSYAQNFEDLLLWRAFHDKKDGFYVDIGAGDPMYLSVTNLFYQNGWTGVNVEPSESLFERLRLARPRDVNLPHVIGEHSGYMTFYECDIYELSTINVDVANQLKEKGRKVTEKIIEMTTLSDVFARYCSNSIIDFLKIDVEGAELEVLKATDFEKYRPRIIVIEATVPETRIDSSYIWENLILDRGYLFTYADGINKYYIRKEEPKLQEHFIYPVGLFDGFQPYELFTALDDRQSLCAEMAAKEAIIVDLKKTTDENLAAANERDARINERDALIHERDALIHEREALIHERDALINERRALINDRDVLINEQDTLIHERGALIHERDALITEKDALISERDALFDERDVRIVERDAAINRAEHAERKWQLVPEWLKRLIGRLAGG